MRIHILHTLGALLLGPRATANQPALGKAGIPSRLPLEHHWPGLPEPRREAS